MRCKIQSRGFALMMEERCSWSALGGLDYTCESTRLCHETEGIRVTCAYWNDFAADTAVFARTKWSGDYTLSILRIDENQSSRRSCVSNALCMK